MEDGRMNDKYNPLYKRSRAIRRKQRAHPITTSTLEPLPSAAPLMIDPPDPDMEIEINACNNSFKAEYVNLAYHLALLGATFEQMGNVFRVHERTVRTWVERYPEFKDALQRGKEQADADVANSLFQRAKGYSHPDVHFTTLRDKDGKGEVIATPTTKYYPPDVTACIFWLKNRQSANWRDVYRQEHTGADGKPITRRLEVDLSKLSDEELALAESAGLKLHANKPTGGGRIN